MFGFIKAIGVSAVFSFFAAAPSSSNFTLKSYDFGSGGGTSSSTNYGLNSELGEQSGGPSSSTSFTASSGTQNTQTAGVPPAPSFTNPSNEYTRLRLVINNGGSPSDTKFQIAISSDGFTTTRYVQTDNTVGTTNTVAQYQTYSAWGGATGIWVTGLLQNTTYQVKVRALQGNFTGSAFGPIATAATTLPSLTFTVATSATSTPPYTMNFTGLAAGSVVTATETAQIGLSTNSMNGGRVYIKSTANLTSASAGFSIPSASADLSVAGSGYGAIVSYTSQASGGPLSAITPYDGTANVVGGLASSLQPLVSSANPVTTGTATVSLKAKITATTPNATDYTDTLTFIAAMLY